MLVSVPVTGNSSTKGMGVLLSRKTRPQYDCQHCHPLSPLSGCHFYHHGHRVRTWNVHGHLGAPAATDVGGQDRKARVFVDSLVREEKGLADVTAWRRVVDGVGEGRTPKPKEEGRAGEGTGASKHGASRGQAGKQARKGLANKHTTLLHLGKTVIVMSDSWGFSILVA